MTETPQSLLERIARNPGNAEPWNELVRLYTPFLQNWCKQLGNLARAESDDIVQDVMVVVLQKLPDFQHNQRTGAFRAWLKGILVNSLRTRTRRAALITFEPALEQVEDPQSDLSRRFDEEHRQHIVRCLLELAEAKFPPQKYHLFHQFVLQKKSAKEVATQNAVTVNVVYLAKSDVLSWLRCEGRGLIDDDF